MDLGCPAYDSAQDQACECSTSANYSGNSTTYFLSGGVTHGGDVHAIVVLAVMAIAAVVLW